MNFRSLALVLGGLAAASTFAACAPTTDYTPQIRVVPGAASRIAMIPSRAARQAAEAAKDSDPEGDDEGASAEPRPPSPSPAKAPEPTRDAGRDADPYGYDFEDDPLAAD